MQLKRVNYSFFLSLLLFTNCAKDGLGFYTFENTVMKMPKKPLGRMALYHLFTLLLLRLESIF